MSEKRITPGDLALADHPPHRAPATVAPAKAGDDPLAGELPRRRAWEPPSALERAARLPSPSATPKANGADRRAPQPTAIATRRRLILAESSPERSLACGRMAPLITFEEALALGELSDHEEIGELVERAWEVRQRELRRLDRHVLARQRQVGRLRRGLRLLRPVPLRGGGHADARDDGARADPRAREGRRGRRRPPLLHGHPGPGALEARLREDPRRREARRRADEPQALRLDRPHVGRARPRRCARPGSSASTTTSSPPAPTTPRSRPRSATRAGCGRSRRSRRPGSRPASAASSTSARRPASGSRWPSSSPSSNPTSVPINLLNPREGTKFGDRPLMDALGGRQVGRDLPPDHPRRPVPPLRRPGREPRRPPAAGGQGGPQRGDDGQLPDHARRRARGRPGDVRGARAERRPPARQRRQPAARQPLRLARRARRRRRRWTS